MDRVNARLTNIQVLSLQELLHLLLTLYLDVLSRRNRLNSHQRLDLVNPRQTEGSVVPVWVLVLQEVFLLLLDNSTKAWVFCFFEQSLLMRDTQLFVFESDLKLYQISGLP